MKEPVMEESTSLDKESTVIEKKHKIFLNMIAGDFEPVETVKRAIDYLAPHIDGIYITITHKKEEPTNEHPLVALVNSYRSETFITSVSTFEWVDDFSAARNYALSQVPKGNDIFVIWTDVDDVWMEPELIPRVVEKMVEDDVKAMYFQYYYQVELDKNGDILEILTNQKRERIIVNDGSFSWVAPLHETLIDQKEENRRKAYLPSPIVVHLTNTERMDKNIERNLRILKKTHIKEDGRDPRTTMYLAKTYYDLAKENYEKDIELYKKYVGEATRLFGEYLQGRGEPGTDEYRTPSGWPEERSTAWSYLSEIALLSGNLDAAEEALKHAIDESEKFPNYYVDLANVYLKKNEIEKAKHWLTIGTSMPEPKTTIITNPRDFKLRAMEVTAQIAIHEKDFEVAKLALEKMLTLLPGTEGIEQRLQVVNSLILFNKACQSAVFLGKYLEQIGEEDKITHLINSFSEDMKKERFASEMRSIFYPPRQWAQNEITIFAGPCFEEWTPDSIKTGLGGSEESIVYLSRELQKLGWYVTVYANPGDKAGVYDGVEYKMWHEFNPADEFNVLVLWRGISFVDMNPKSKFTVLWMHDVPNCAEFTPERLEKIDRIIVLSEYHKSLFLMNDNGEMKDIPESKFWLSSNGIIPLRPSGKRKTNSIIYGSSPDRGLIYLLNNWDFLKKEIPDLTLDVYYGFQVFDAIHKHNPERMAWKKKIMELMDRDGITYHGRVGHKELHDAYARADVWIYPTDFSEISCITGMKSQALGAIPFVTDFGALSETVKFGSRVDVDITDPEGQKEFFSEFIKFMKDKKNRKEIRKDMTNFSQEYFLWSRVAEEWSNVFKMEVRSE